MNKDQFIINKVDSPRDIYTSERFDKKKKMMDAVKGAGHQQNSEVARNKLVL